MAGWIGNLTLFVYIAVIGACATPDVDPTALSAKRVVLAPVNFDSPTLPQLEPGLDLTYRLVDLFLRHRGLEVERVPLERFQSLWNSATGGQGLDLNSPADGVAAAHVLDVLAHGDADCVLVLPGIDLRTGVYRGTKLNWDGVSEPPMVEGLARDSRIDKPMTGVSIWIRVFDPSGVQIHEGYGGVEQFRKTVGWEHGHINFEGRQAKAHSSLNVVREDLFQNPKKVATGIRLAFDPYIP